MERSGCGPASRSQIPRRPPQVELWRLSGAARLARRRPPPPPPPPSRHPPPHPPRIRPHRRPGLEPCGPRPHSAASRILVRVPPGHSSSAALVSASHPLPFQSALYTLPGATPTPLPAGWVELSVRPTAGRDTRAKAAERGLSTESLGLFPDAG